MINGYGATEAINKLIVTLLADLSSMESEQIIASSPTLKRVDDMGNMFGGNLECGGL